MSPANSSHTLVGLNSPKATLTFFPKDPWWVPEIAISFGKSFFTEDPRTGSAFGQATATGAPEAVDPVETARSYQLVAATLRQNFRNGSLLATFEQADARDLGSGQVQPEAPRSIGDFLATYQKLPFHLLAKGEFEYVGRKVVGNGCNEANPDDLTSYCLGVPNKEFRLSLARPFQGEKINVGVNMLIARGYTGQTVENFASNYQPGGVGPLPVPENPVAEVVGVRIPSYAKRECDVPVWT